MPEVEPAHAGKAPGRERLPTLAACRSLCRAAAPRRCRRGRRAGRRASGEARPTRHEPSARPFVSADGAKNAPREASPRPVTYGPPRRRPPGIRITSSTTGTGPRARSPRRRRAVPQAAWSTPTATVVNETSPPALEGHARHGAPGVRRRRCRPSNHGLPEVDGAASAARAASQFW